MSNRFNNRITITTPTGQQRLETDIAWEFFCHYRDLGEKRSYQKVAKDFGKTKAYVEQIAKKYDWQKRIHEMVDYEQEQKKKEKLRKKKNTVKRHENIFKTAQADIQKDIESIDNDPLMSQTDKAKAKATLYDKLYKAIEGERTAIHLPKQYNDKQKVEAETQVKGDLTLTNKLLFKDKESYHKKIIDELEDLIE